VLNCLEPGVIQIHRVKLEASEEIIAAFEGFLCLDEIEHARRFRFPWLRSRYILARGALRLFLANYLNAQAREIRFDYGQQGKPRIHDAGLEFNISHSESIALMAFSRECEVGVDVEIIRPMADLDGLAQRFFHPAEVAELRSLAPEAQQEAFFVCWTRKEAYLKAGGEGLSIPLDSFRVTLSDSPQIVVTKNEQRSRRACRLWDLSSRPDYAAALAYRGDPIRISTEPFTDPRQTLENL